MRRPSPASRATTAGATPCRISAAAPGELNLAPRAYHSGDYEEIGWILARMAAQHGGPVLAVGISLGGNMLLRWAEEAGFSAARRAHAVAAVCSPLDLAAGGHAIGRGFAATSTPACSCAR